MDYNAIGLQLYENSKEQLLIAFLHVFEMFKPMLISVCIGMFITSLARFVVRKIRYNFCIITGYSKRESKRKAKKTAEIVDLISALNDINSSEKGNRK